MPGFRATRQLNKDEVRVSMGDASSASAVTVGDVYLCILDSVLVLKDVLYVPDFRRNLISVSKLNESGYSVIFL